MVWNENEVPTVTYLVVINHEEHYSTWSDFKEIPAGWHAAGKSGSKDECFAYINELRPLSLRKQMAQTESQKKNSRCLAGVILQCGFHLRSASHRQNYDGFTACAEGRVGVFRHRFQYFPQIMNILFQPIAFSDLEGLVASKIAHRIYKRRGLQAEYRIDLFSVQRINVSK
ncbi:MbtH family protein [Nitrosomonas sp. JL21]|uniref:MbtH family protein n=1 Tax=Nitrosomonas sp. JL21 TaxID=153949 RepID=UPI00136B1B89|nr:MbtH family protein [Nitrosomonas sp. JL21]MBL8496963.1 MbtH family protein [Nitrosomonas sp.]MCC7091844.1 MbtH family protein [Nitrosomonas sp.]MXS78593.1 MbtH family protein [Nitrosomonas sp. JL21]